MNNTQTPPLRRNDMDLDPFNQFTRWFKDAEQANISQPSEMTLATASRQGTPSARIVLLRGVDDRGFVFFSNYQSRKGQDLLENPMAALVFRWQLLSRQVRVEGAVERLTASESDSYFANRPRGHQLEAHASPQSQVIKDRSFLEKQFADAAREFSGAEVSRPLHWGGYRVVPESLEFWQEGENRLHDRLRYRRNRTGTWTIERLAP
ncbi:MAG: pyridoxamine 5'-phosphate oxidase [Desulfuromonadales bacterium]|nr:pyridoxamine 5'-phosphate oxidase [Desulfuromonadales bacterium]